MKGAIFVFIIAVLLFSFMAGCFEPPTPPKPPKPNVTENLTENQTVENVTKEIVVGPCRGLTRADVDACLLNKSLCSYIEDASLKDSCYFTATNCSGIVNDEMRHNCQISVGFSMCANDPDQSLCKALASNDLFYCGTNSECLLKFAFKTNSSKACDAITSGSMDKSACNSILLMDPYRCYVYEQYDASRKECIKTFARITGTNGNICNQISDQIYREDCQSSVAYSSGNYSECLPITSYKTRKDCLIDVAGKLKDPSLCEYSGTFASAAKDIAYCKVRVAQINLMPSICQDINESGYIWGCFADSIVDNETLRSECDKITDPLYRDWQNQCYQRARTG